MINTIKNPSGHAKKILGLLVFLGIALYSIFAARGILRSPRVIVEYPVNGSTVHEALVRLQGEVSTLSYLKINGRNIPIHENNTFSNAVVLKEGYNIITLEAGDRFGRVTRQTIELMRARDTLKSS